MIIYLIISPSNKAYVGQTIKSLQARWTEHKKHARYGYAYPVHRAIRKYGDSSFVVQEIAKSDNQEDLNNLERVFITLFRSCDPNYGYNLRYGGSKGKHADETIEKMSLAAKGRTFSPETLAKMKDAAKGRVFSEETRAKLREARKNSTYNRMGVGMGSPHGVRSEEWKMAQSLARKGRPWTEARRAAQNKKIKE